MARDAGLDLEAEGPTSGLLRPPPAAGPIAQERGLPGPPGAPFVLATVALVVATLAVALTLGARGGQVAAEDAATELAVWGDLDVHAARAVAAVAQAAVVAGVAVAGRRLAHSDLAGTLAAALVAADPAGLLLGSLALPHTLAVAGLVWALAFGTSPLPLLHWLAGAALALATLAVPAAAAAALPLALLLLLRGHIYAAPRHFALALAQVALLPALALGSRAAVQGDLAAVPACLDVSAGPALTLRTLASPGSELLLIPDPVTWLAGAGALAFLGLGGVGFALGRFRMARAPGRLQFRLASPFPPVLGRGAWLLLLAVFTPPVAWLPLFAIALAMGVRELGEDAPGFGLALAVVLLAFAALVLWRAWDAVVGDPGGLERALDLVPWARSATC